jgi:hypothetical protein
MQRILFGTLFLAGMISSFMVMVAWSEDDWRKMMPEGAGKDLTVQLCNTCHNLQKTAVSRKTPKEWEKTVYDMVARGAQIFPDEAEQIVKYLATSFPPGK